LERCPTSNHSSSQFGSVTSGSQLLVAFVAHWKPRPSSAKNTHRTCVTSLAFIWLRSFLECGLRRYPILSINNFPDSANFGIFPISYRHNVFFPCPNEHSKFVLVLSHINKVVKNVIRIYSRMAYNISTHKDDLYTAIQ